MEKEINIKSSYMNRKVIFSWALYDWANSAFATTIMAGLFPIFFIEYYGIGRDAETLYGHMTLANAISGIIVALLAPILGSIADKGSTKKRFLTFFAYMGVVMTAGLYLVAQGNWFFALVLYVFATIGFSGSNIFYDSLLPAVATEKQLDVVSAIGYSLGYLGGGVLFAVNVMMVLHPAWFGLVDTSIAFRVAFLSVALWWAIFSIPIILFVKEPAAPKSVSGWAAIRGGFAQLKQTFRKIRYCKTIFTFLIAYWLYIDGIDTIIRQAVVYARSIGFERNTLITALLVTQFVGFPAAIAFGYLGKRIGAKQGIFIGILVYLFVAVWGAFINHPFEFYILAVTIGLVQGGVQSLSRSFFARIIPPGQSAEFFGFYNMLGKFAVVIGPVLICVVLRLSRLLGVTEESTRIRLSITSISLLFLAGAAVLWSVDEIQGKQEARQLTEKSQNVPISSSE